MSRRADDGVAAVEMALVFTLFMLLAFGALPLYSMMRGQQKVTKAASSAARYAASVDANGTRPAGGGAISRRPTAAEVQTFARNAVSDTGLTVVTQICPGDVDALCAPGNPSSAKSGDGVRVTVSTPVDLSVLGSIANAVGSLVGSGSIAPQGVVTMSSTATGREE